MDESLSAKYCALSGETRGSENGKRRGDGREMERSRNIFRKHPPNTRSLSHNTRIHSLSHTQRHRTYNSS
jgi:hypothetical protein